MPSALLLVSRPEPAPGDCSLATEGRPPRRPSVGREATSLYRSVTVQLIDRSAVANCCHGSHLEFRDHAIFRFENLMTQVAGFWPKIRRLGSLDSQIETFPVGFTIFGLHKQGHSFLRSKSTTLKLEIEPHRKQPEAKILKRIYLDVELNRNHSITPTRALENPARGYLRLKLILDPASFKAQFSLPLDPRLSPLPTKQHHVLLPRALHLTPTLSGTNIG